MNIMSTLGEEVLCKCDGDDCDGSGESSNEAIKSENKVLVRMRDRDKKSLSRPQSDETSRVRSPSTQSLVLRGRDARGAPRWMLERSRSAFIKPWYVLFHFNLLFFNGSLNSLDDCLIPEGFCLSLTELIT